MTTAIDLFAGAGGFTEGARQAGIRVVWAANHWRAAVDTHAANHPEAEHVCQDLQQADWTALPRHDVLLASPSCTGHTRARGRDRPHHDAARATAWAVVSCAEVHRQDLIVCENVVDWTRWRLWPAWCSAMHALGYAVSPNVVDAADYGVPQNRKRVIVVCTRSKHPLELRSRRAQHQHAAPLIQWTEGRWRKIDKTLAPATLARIAHGHRAFGDRFAISYYGNTETARSLDRPLGTLTTRDRWAIINGDRMRMLNIREGAAVMSFPASYKLPSQHKLAMHMLGNAIPPGLAYGVLAEVKAAA